MASPIYMWVTDEAGNAINGSVNMTDERDGSIEVIQLKHGIETPTDKHSGSLTGMRRHNAVSLKKAIDASSSELFKAVSTGKTLNNITLRFYHIDDEGTEQEYYRVEYDNVKVTKYEMNVPNVKEEDADRFPHLEDIEFRYEKMTVNFADGNLTHSDSWKERVGKIAA